jgi:hypothetical protein
LIWRKLTGGSVTTRLLSSFATFLQNWLPCLGSGLERTVVTGLTGLGGTGVSLLDLVTRERTKRSVPPGDDQVIIWRWNDEQAAAEIEAAKAAGRIGPGTEVIVVGWGPCADAAEARP